MSKLFFFLLLTLKLTLSADSFRVGIIEHDVQYDKAADSLVEVQWWNSYEQAVTVMNKNLQMIGQKVSEAAAAGADLVLVGEMSLTGVFGSSALETAQEVRSRVKYYLESLPEAGQGIVACDDSSYSQSLPIFYQLSCLAKENDVYLAFNWGDLQECEQGVDLYCDDGEYEFNTQLIFDNTGDLIAKYYKIHNFKEKEFNPSVTQDPVSFELELSDGTTTTIGIMVCYDSGFPTPGLEYVNQGIKNILVSHWWVNDIPGFMANSWFRAISDVWDVNLIVAASVWNLFNDWTRKYSSGSGVFSEGEVIKSWYNNLYVPGPRLTIADVPILDDDYVERDVPDPIETESCDFYYSTWQLINGFTTSVLNTPVTVDETFQSLSGEATSIECYIKGTYTTTQSEAWVFEAQSGFFFVPDNLGTYMAVEMCGVHASALLYGYSKSLWTSISIGGTFSDDTTLYFFLTDGTTVDVNPSAKEFEKTVDSNGVTWFTYTGDALSVSAMNIYGRRYPRDTRVVSSNPSGFYEAGNVCSATSKKSKKIFSSMLNNLYQWITHNALLLFFVASILYGYYYFHYKPSIYKNKLSPSSSSDEKTPLNSVEMTDAYTVI